MIPIDDTSDNQNLGEILALVAKHDQNAFQRLYRETSGHLYGVLLRMLKHEELAEDVLQETFVKIWRSAHAFSAGKGRPLTWMTSIARHHALDVLRSNTAALRRDSDYAFETDAQSGTSRIEEHLIDSQLLAICLQRIEEPARDCVIKAYCEGYTHSELSRHSGAAPGTVKSWIRRALEKLRECVNELS